MHAAAPYKGLASYTEDDADLFFGRDRECEVIVSNFKARRLTVLYGESGVGKSSLIRAGVAARLYGDAVAETEQFGGPDFVPVVFSRWRDDPAAGVAQAVCAAAARFDTSAPSTGRMRDDIAAAASSLDAYLLVMLDQFEEYFLYHPFTTDGDAFDEEFPLVLKTPGLQASFVVSIREDALAKLDRFKSRVPWLLDSSLRVDRLDSASARAAIICPLERYSEQMRADEKVSVEPALVDAVLDQVTAGRVLIEQHGRGSPVPAGEGGALDDKIELPYLQLVMTTLWDTERAQDSHTLHASTLAALGGAEQIVRTHLDGALSDLTPAERADAVDVFHHLVTPSGAKVAHLASDLAEYARRPEPEVHALLEKLASADTRIIRPIAPPPGDDGPPRFEIYHDVLAPSILDWRSRERERAARRRMRLSIVGVIGIALACIAIAVLIGIHRVNQADAARKEAALTRSIAAFDAATQSRYGFSQPSGAFVFHPLEVTSQPGAHVEGTTSCTRCGRFSGVIGPTGNIAIRGIEGSPLPVGTTVSILVTSRGIGKRFEFRIHEAGVETTRERCRPRGSPVAETTLPEPCP